MIRKSGNRFSGKIMLKQDDPRRIALQRNASRGISMVVLPAKIGNKPSTERDQQNWEPVLRPIALRIIRWTNDPFAKPLTLWRIMR
jgi:hypothetical protein